MQFVYQVAGFTACEPADEFKLGIYKLIVLGILGYFYYTEVYSRRKDPHHNTHRRTLIFAILAPVVYMLMTIIGALFLITFCINSIGFLPFDFGIHYEGAALISFIAFAAIVIAFLMYEKSKPQIMRWVYFTNAEYDPKEQALKALVDGEERSYDVAANFKVHIWVKTVEINRLAPDFSGKIGLDEDKNVVGMRVKLK